LAFLLNRQLKSQHPKPKISSSNQKSKIQNQKIPSPQSKIKSPKSKNLFTSSTLRRQESALEAPTHESKCDRD
jgi:hypothetical protein